MTPYWDSYDQDDLDEYYKYKDSMEKQYDNTNKGALFSAADKKQEETDRDYKGTLNIEGIEYWVSGWKKVSKAGQTFLSLAVTPKEQRVQQANPEVQQRATQYPSVNSVQEDSVDSMDVPF